MLNLATSTSYNASATRSPRAYFEGPRHLACGHVKQIPKCMSESPPSDSVASALLVSKQKQNPRAEGPAETKTKVHTTALGLSELGTGRQESGDASEEQPPMHSAAFSCAQSSADCLVLLGTAQKRRYPAQNGAGRFKLHSVQARPIRGHPDQRWVRR